MADAKGREDKGKARGDGGRDLAHPKNLASFVPRMNGSETCSGVPRILEREGSRCSRRRGGWGVERGYPPPHWGMDLVRGGCASLQKFFIYFVGVKVKTYFDAF